MINVCLVMIVDLEYKYGESLVDVLVYYDQIKEEFIDMEVVVDLGFDLEEWLNVVQVDLLN